MSPENSPNSLSKPPDRPDRRRLLTASAAAALLAFASPGIRASTPYLRLIGEARLPHGLQFEGTTLGGLSGIDYDPASGLYYLVCDDASAREPARFYTARIALDSDYLGVPEFTAVTALRQADGSPYTSWLPGGKQLDPEAIRWRGESRTLLWTSEGNMATGTPPSLNESRPDGSLLRTFTLPTMFGSALGQGPRNNRSLEGLALSPDGKSAWLAMEAAMLQDGPLPKPTAPGGPCRFTQIDIASGKVLRQIAYVPDAIPRPPIPAFAHASNGVSEILMLDADRMLVLERAYMAGYGTDNGNSLRLYLIDTRQGSDTLKIPALQAGKHTPAGKTLLANFSSFVGPGKGKRLDRLDNTEGMTWGPLLANGRRSLIFISDNNFSARQITQLLAFEFTG